MLINKDVIALCDISRTCFIYVYLFTKICTHTRKKVHKTEWQLIFWYSVLFCRLWPDVVTSGDASMTTAVNRELALCLTDVEGKPPPPPSLLLLLLLLFYFFFFFSFVFFIQCRRDRSRRADCVGTIHRQRRSDAGWNMSGEKATSPCNKFQANIFNKSKCQNCFKSRELHLLNDHDMEQVSQR